MTKNITFKVKLDYSKIPNPMHLDAMIRFPKIVYKDRSKFDRNKNKRMARKEIKNY